MTINNLTIREEQGHGKLRWIRFSLATHSGPTLADRAASYRQVERILRTIETASGVGDAELRVMVAHARELIADAWTGQPLIMRQAERILTAAVLAARGPVRVEDEPREFDSQSAEVSR